MRIWKTTERVAVALIKHNRPVLALTWLVVVMCPEIIGAITIAYVTLR